MQMKEARMSTTAAKDFCGSITKQNKLMKLAESIKGKKKQQQQSSKNGGHCSIVTNKKILRLDPGYTPSIEHLVNGVYRSKSATSTPEKRPQSAADEQTITTRSDAADDQIHFDARGGSVAVPPLVVVTRDGSTVYANMPALRSHLPGAKDPPDSCVHAKTRRQSAPNFSASKMARTSTNPASRAAPRGGSGRSSLPVPKHTTRRTSGTQGAENVTPNRQNVVRTNANARSASCDRPRPTNRASARSQGRPADPNVRKMGIPVSEDRPCFSRKYCSSTYLGSCNNLRASSCNIEKKITAFKRNRASSETNLISRRTSSGSGVSFIPVPIRSSASKIKYARNVTTNSSMANNSAIGTPEHRPDTTPRSPNNNLDCEDEWTNSPKIRALQDEDQKAKSACEELDLLIKFLPENPQDLGYRMDQSSAISPRLPNCCDSRDGPITSSRSSSALHDRRRSEPFTHANSKKQHRSSFTFSDSDLDDSSVLLSRSSFYCSFGGEEFQLAPRYSSLRTNAIKTSESVLQKFKKSFSVRFNRNKFSEVSSDPPTPAHLSADQMQSHFYCINDRLVLDPPDLSFHPAAISGVSPCTNRKNDQSTIVPTSPGHEPVKSSSMSRGSSKYRNTRDRKDVRGSKCSSTDSGIQIELSTVSAVNPNVLSRDCSSPSPLDNSCKNMKSENATVVRRQSKSTSRKDRRPHSDLGGYINDPALLAEAIRIGLVVESPSKRVARTLSDPTNNKSKSPSCSADLNHYEPVEDGPRQQICQLQRDLLRSNSQPLLCHKNHHERTGSFRKRSSYKGCPLKSNSLSLSNHHLGTPKHDLENNEFASPGDDQAFMSFTYAEAVFDHVTMDPDELAFRAGDVVQVIDSTNENWWWGIIKNKCGWFPASRVWLRVNQEKPSHHHSKEYSCVSGTVHSTEVQNSETDKNADRIRKRVINEIISNERDYVTHLRNVCDGYLNQVYKRPDMFSDEQVSTIFGNIEQIYLFHCSFLEDLKSCYNEDEPHKSRIGSCFLSNKENFQIYSEYCNNHPQALSLLQELYTNPKYPEFFEACRLLQDMINISLDGFLLNPVQKICKYPLQLAELLKYTNFDHQDYSCVKNARETMKNVAHSINEKKRRMECLEKLVLWQHGIVDWEGCNLIDESSELIHSGEVSKVTAWSREVCLFLFDHQLIYCKKDLLKRNVFVYKGRINMDKCELKPIEDNYHFGIKNAWKIRCNIRNKNFVFHTRTAEEKEKWMSAFLRERLRVKDDKDAGFGITDKARQQAISAADKSRKIKRPKVKSLKQHGYQTGTITKQSSSSIVNGDLLFPPENSLKTRTGSLPHGVSLSVNNEVVKKKSQQNNGSWFNFGSTKKLKR